MHFQAPATAHSLLRWADAHLPLGHIPSSHLARARALAASRQPLAFYADLLPFFSRGSTFRRFIYVPDKRQLDAIFDPSAHDIRAFHLRSWSLCTGCGRPALVTTPGHHVVCSPVCLLALRLLACDVLALSGQQRPSPNPPYALLLSFIASRHLGDSARKTIARHVSTHATHKRTPESFSNFILVGKAAKADPLGFSSAVLVPPHVLRESIRQMLKNTPPLAEPDPETALSDAKALAPAMPSGHGPMAESADSEYLSPPAPASTNPLSIPSGSSGFLANPVSRRAAEIVLHHLETANNVLAIPKGEAKKEHVWSRDQVNLFLGLYNRTVPALSASLNISATPEEPEDPAEMSREQLERAAAKAKPVEAYRKSKAPIIENEQ